MNDVSTRIPAAAPIVGDEERAAVDQVMRSGQLAQGKEVAAFEEEFRPVAGTAHCVAVNSGTAALHLGLLACGIGPGDEVIVPSFTFAATANAVALTGARPVFADIELATFCLDLGSVRSLITPATAGIMPVHLYGHPAAMGELRDLAASRSLALFEDAAQAHAASYDGSPVGSFGQFAAFSFYPTKNMTSGEGGMIACQDAEVARLTRLLRNQGMERRYANEVVGFNARMTDIHAAIGRVQLRKLAGWTAQRQANAAYLNEHLRGVITPITRPRSTHVYHQYTIRVPAEDRDAFVSSLEEHGVGSGVYYPTPVHALASFGQDLELPATTQAAQEVISLPVHPSLSPNDLERIVIVVNSVAAAGR